MMREKDPASFLPLHHNWFHILLSLAGAGQHGSLKRLIADGLIEESDERTVAELDDARRRYYRLTRLGRTVLELECERLQEMVRMMQRKRRQEAYQ